MPFFFTKIFYFLFSMFCLYICYVYFPDTNNSIILLGSLAAKYEELAGEVKWMGKPDKVMH